MKAILYLALMMLAGCAYPGRPALVSNSAQWNLTVNKSSDELTSCLVSGFDHEPWSMMGLRAPANRIDRGGQQSRIASVSDGDLWLWEIVVTPKGNSSFVEAFARNDAGGPYLSKGYMTDKVKGVIDSCG